jgi:hypothetical protein
MVGAGKVHGLELMETAMAGRQVALYFAWIRRDEVAGPLDVLDRFPALFELRRMFWPRFEQFADPATFNQGIGGFLDTIQLANFKLFAELAASWTGNPVRRAERRTDAGLCALDAEFLAGVDTLVVISFDSSRTRQQAGAAEIDAIRSFLDDPDHTLFVCPHHDIGNVDGLPEGERQARRELEFHHHGDPAIPGRQCFGDFGISLLEGLGLPVRNRFGLRPAKLPDGSPAPLEIVAELDRSGLMQGVHDLQSPCAPAAFREARRERGKARCAGAPTDRSSRSVASLYRRRAARPRRPAAVEAGRVSRPPVDLRHDDVQPDGGRRR